MRTERAIQSFMWTEDWGEMQKLAYEHFEAKTQVLSNLDFQPAEGALDWLSILNEYKVPCCACAGSSLDRKTAEAALSSAGLHSLLDEYVTAEDGCETTEQCYLLACIKVRRPPGRCVVFEDDQRGIVAAHDAMTKVVAVLSSSSSHGDLRHADMRVTDLDCLSLMALRELFKGP